MKDAHAGGGEMSEQYIQEPTQVTAMHDLPKDDLARSIVNQIGDAVGYWPLLGVIVVGVGVIARKRIKKWILK